MVKIRILIRKIKRSFRSSRDRWIKAGILAAILLVLVIFGRSCACGTKNKKEPDAASTSVMKITPIPTPTPTAVPRQVNKDAVAVSGSVTMINEYLVQKEEAEAEVSEQPSEGEEQSGDAEE